MRFLAAAKERTEIMLDLLIEGAVIVTMDPRGSIVNSEYVAISEGRIVEPGDMASLERRDARVKIDGRGKALLP